MSVFPTLSGNEVSGFTILLPTHSPVQLPFPQSPQSRDHHLLWGGRQEEGNLPQEGKEERRSCGVVKLWREERKEEGGSFLGLGDPKNERATSLVFSPVLDGRSSVS